MITDPYVPEKIFVYGSLMRDFYNFNKALSGKVLSSAPARVKGTLYHLVEEGYPALVSGDGWVYGELIQLKNFKDTVVHLDQIENYYPDNANNEYERLITPVQVIETGSEEQAYVYWYSCEENIRENAVILVEDGDWRNFMYQHQT